MTETVIDEAVFNEVASLMGDALSSFLETYLDNSPKLLAAMKEAIPADDLDAVVHNAHQLKGGSGSIGAMLVFRLATQLEEEARGAKKDDLARAFAELEVAYGVLAEELKRICRNE